MDAHTGRGLGFSLSPAGRGEACGGEETLDRFGLALTWIAEAIRPLPDRERSPCHTALRQLERDVRLCGRLGYSDQPRHGSALLCAGRRRCELERHQPGAMERLAQVIDRVRVA